MTDRRNIAASVRQRVFNASRARREDFQVTLTRYALERLLYRLGKSAHRDIQPAPECNSIKDLIEQYEEIWV